MNGPDHPCSVAARRRREAVYLLLCDVADAGDPFPQPADLGGEGAAYRDLRALREAGLIRTESTANRRRVQIVATGRWTGWTYGWAPAATRRFVLPDDPEAAFAAAMRGRRYADLPGYERVGAGWRAPMRQPAYSPSTSSAAWAA